MKGLGVNQINQKEENKIPSSVNAGCSYLGHCLDFDGLIGSWEGRGYHYVSRSLLRLWSYRKVGGEAERSLSIFFPSTL